MLFTHNFLKNKKQFSVLTASQPVDIETYSFVTFSHTKNDNLDFRPIRRQIVIENTSILDKKSLISLNIANYKHTVLPISLILEGIIILMAIFISWAGESTYFSILWIVAILFPIMIILVMVLSVRKIMKSDQSVLKGTTVHFVFNDEQVNIDAKNDISESKATLRYSMIHHVLDTKTHLFLFQNAINAFVIDKNTFSVGTADELISLLRKNQVKILSRIMKRK
jgi:hypothetical protein